MPADFPQSFKDALTAFNSTTGGATSFASRLVTLINAAFGPSNPFGTAATRDAGTAADNIPVLGADGLIDSGQLRQAFGRTQPGTVLIADTLSNTEPPGAVVPPSVVRAAVGNVTQGLLASDIGIAEIIANRGAEDGVYETLGSGFLIGIGGGMAGPNSNGTAGANGQPAIIQYGAASSTGFTNDSPSLIASGGDGIRRRAFQVLAIDATATTAGRAPSWAFVRSGVGASGGKAGFTANTAPSARGDNGSVVVAYFEGAGKHVRVINNGRGRGGVAAPAGTGVAGQNGDDGGVFFIQID